MKLVLLFFCALKECNEIGRRVIHWEVQFCGFEVELYMCKYRIWTHILNSLYAGDWRLGVHRNLQRRSKHAIWKLKNIAGAYSM